MEFQIGDRVVHCNHGLGQIIALEERAFSNKNVLYYMIQVADLTIWVPADENLNTRLRPPTSESDFKKLFSILSGPAEALPGDRRLRNLNLQERLANGMVESLCTVIRDLAAYRHARTWNEYDNAMMKRAQKTLIGEWCFSLSVTPQQAENELHRLLSHKTD